MTRAYSVLRIKAADAATRTIRGVASTPEPDRMGDVIEPLGITFRNPAPLLLYHNTQKPVGLVRFAMPTKDGLHFEAEIPTIAEPGALRDRIEEAWQSVTSGLLAGVSIGFRALEETYDKVTGGYRFLKTEVLELSLVTIPANASASIHSIKALDLAASGRHSPGISGTFATGTTMTTAEQITAFTDTRTSKAARMTALMDAAAKDAVTLDGKQTEEYDALTIEVANIDKHIDRLKALEQTQAAIATPIIAAATTTGPKASEVRGGAHVPVITVKSTVPPGTSFVRYACALLACKGNRLEAAEYARQRWESSTPEVALQLKAAMTPGTVADADWAGALVNPVISSDFLELLRPATILGRIPNLRRVPFNVKVPSQTAGGTYGWVGEGKPKPVTELAFSSETLGVTKAAGIIVLTEELVRLSNPSAEALCRADMIAGIAKFLDAQFIDPAVAAVAGVNPASITNGAGTAAASDDPLADILALIASFAAANIPTAGITIIMSEANALALAFQTNTDGSAAFPGVTATGGSFKGINIVASQAAGTNVIALQPSFILVADDGGVTVDMSREASLQMDSAPTSPADATTVLVSLWQHNLVGLRAERFINWKRVNTSAVRYLTAAAYPARVPPPAALAASTSRARPSAS